MENNQSSKTSQMSDDIRELAKAFLQAKMIMGSVKNNSKSNLHKYADLGAVYEAVEEALHDNNIFIWHFAESIDSDNTMLHTRLTHAPSGQFVQDTRFLKSEKPGNQAMGSANTYMRRYAVLSLCALDTSDDDGEDERRYIEKAVSIPIRADQVEELQKMMRAYSINNEMYQKMLGFNKVSELSELNQTGYINVMNYIKKNGKLKE